MLLTVAGYAVGHLLGFILAHLLAGEVIIAITTGAGVGFLQWRELRRFVQLSGWRWVLATKTGLTVSMSLYAVAITYIWEYSFELAWPGGVLRWALAFLLGGALVGLSQHWMLRRQVGRSAWWVPASAGGWSLSVLGLEMPIAQFGLELPGARPTGFFGVLEAVVLFLPYAFQPPVLAGAIPGTVTGGALIWLLRQPAPRNAS